MKALVALVCAALALGACKKSKAPVIAQLEQMTADVERMPAAKAPWQPARVGDTFVLGSGVRTGDASHAKLRVGKSGKLDVNPRSVVYFTSTPGRERSDMRVEAGIAELEAVDEAVGVGEAVLDPGTRARVEAGPQGTTIVVQVGRAVLEDNVIAAGQQITIGPAGKAIATKAAGDGGLAASGDQIAVAVRDKPARIKTAAGESELAVGEHPVEAGATLMVPAGSTVEIARGGARAVTSGPGVLRIGIADTLAQIESGTLALHGETGAAKAGVPGGTVTARPGSDAALGVDGKTTSIDAQRGDTDVESAKGKQTLTAGQSGVLGDDGELTRAAPAPARTVAGITAGESPTVHDAKAPTPLRIAFGDACPSTGVVEVAKDRGFKKVIARSGGAGGANVLVPAGTFSYRVRCDGGKGATGTVHVVKDSGRTPLPKAAARTTVEMDGREYTILYQNLLPELQLSWRTAPKRAKYTFVIKPAHGAEKRVASATPMVKLAAGVLREGSYKVWAEPETGSRSEDSRIVIEFDNAAQSASIDGVEASGDKLHVKGTVIESSTVSADGAPIELDRHRRFAADLRPSEGEDGVGVRIAHPKAGIHYYVMRTAPP